MTDPTQRFTGRVENYVRFRPGYPPEVIEVLRRECGLSPSSVVADIGSGTGFLSQLFLENGNRVFGVEPNDEMREAGERILAGYPNFTSVAATAEETTLLDSSVDFIVAGQAFHWFDPGKARREFERISKPGGWVALVWNSRSRRESPFSADYEEVVRRHGKDYEEVSHGRRGSPEEIRAFFSPEVVEAATFSNRQTFDFDGLKGRILSSSYAPAEDEPGCEEMMEDLAKVFEDHQSDGTVDFHYETKVYYGRLSRD
ncbi:MAG: class I SAM-dependent methyltransferase [Rubrobacter sp.]|nr:class I SAM-dependent methyltransferase [Rubrobacter sp.]